MFGLIAAIAMGLQNYNGQNTWQGWAGAVAVAAWAFFSKDFNISGTK